MASTQRSMDQHSSKGKRSIAAAAERNKDPILEVLKAHIVAQPATATTILEVASGTGQHAAFFSPSFPKYKWQPTEAIEECFESIEAWAEDSPNIKPPLLLDASTAPETWPVDPESCIAMLCVNMTHISPWESTQGLLMGAGRALCKKNGKLFIYGPFKVDGKATTDSNAAFDINLRGQNPKWGLRDVADVDSVAEKAELKRIEMLPMPANNFTLIYQKV